MFYPRYLTQNLLEAAKDTPAVLLTGARQTGKSTLMQDLFEGTKGTREYITLDDLTVLAAATRSPADFVANLPKQVLLDEVQRAPGIFLPIKQNIDQDRVPGRFLMTGSAHVLAFQEIADALAGRMEIHTLWPLSQVEIRDTKANFIDWMFSDKPSSHLKPVEHKELCHLMINGGYPESLARANQKRRDEWFKGYLNTLLERDVRELSNIEGLQVMPSLLSLIAGRIGGLLNNSDLGRSLSLPTTSLRRYLALLNAAYLTVLLPAWAVNVGKRVVKSPKIFLNDTGLLCHLLGVDESRLASSEGPIGPVLENFVALELTKQLGWSRTDASLFHFRTVTGQEVDFVLEARDGSIVGLEVKAARSITEKAFSGLNALKESTKRRFRRGVVIYRGDKAVNFGNDFLAVPVSGLWNEK